MYGRFCIEPVRPLESLCAKHFNLCPFSIYNLSNIANKKLQIVKYDYNISILAITLLHKWLKGCDIVKHYGNWLYQEYTWNGIHTIDSLSYSLAGLIVSDKQKILFSLPHMRNYGQVISRQVLWRYSRCENLRSSRLPIR